MAPNKSPYKTGAEFVLRLDTLKPCEPIPNNLIRIRVLRQYSFTNGQSMKVAVVTQPDGYDLPSTTFLKLYDRRFLRDRMMKHDKEPWTAEQEAEAEKVRMKLGEHTKLAHQLAEDSDFEVGDSDDSESDEEGYGQELKALKQWDRAAFESWRIELKHSRETERWFKNECQAYRQLHTLQGRCIPKFYGIVELHETSEARSYKHLAVPGILLEFIEDVSLEALESESPLALANRHIGQATVDCLDS